VWSEFQKARSEFDKLLRSRRRQYNRGLLLYIETLATNNPTAFWDQIKQMGPNKSYKIPFEIVNENGTISNDLTNVLDHWRSEFSKLYDFSLIESTCNNDPNFIRECKNRLLLAENDMQDPLFNPINQLDNNFTLPETHKALSLAKPNKATGVDAIPADILKLQVLLPVLLNFFQLCFDTGIVPTVWQDAIVVPIPK
jgi:hypothetical protein